MLSRDPSPAPSRDHFEEKWIIVQSGASRDGTAEYVSKMASSGKDRPNLKICIDNVEESSDVGMSDVEEEDVIVNTNIDDNSFDDEEEGDSSVDVKIEERPVSGLRDQRVKDKVGL